jgi:Major Facilitator Superfamily.
VAAALELVDPPGCRNSIPTDIAFVFAFIGLVAIVMQGFLIRKLVPRFGEARLAVSGLTLMALAFGMIAFVPAGWMLYPATAVLAIGSGTATPSLTSLISRRVSPQAQGSALGGVQSLNSLMMVIGPLFIKLIDTVDLEGGPGTSFCSL